MGHKTIIAMNKHFLLFIVGDKDPGCEAGGRVAVLSGALWVGLTERGCLSIECRREAGLSSGWWGRSRSRSGGVSGLRCPGPCEERGVSVEWESHWRV